MVNNDAGCALELAATPAATTGEDSFGSSTSFVNSSFGLFSAELDSAAFDDVDDDDDDDDNDGDNTLHCRTGSAAASDAATDARGVEDRSCLTSKSSSSSSDSSATACTVSLSGCDDIDDGDDDDVDNDLAMAVVAAGKYLSLFEF